MSATDIVANRKAVKWTRREQALRFLFAVVQPTFRLSPRQFWGWRRWILRRFGAVVGPNVHIFPTVRITIPWNLTLEEDCAVGDRAILYALGPITIGKRATISQGVHLCAGTHDWRDPKMPLQKLPIVIGNDAWVCADAFVGPNVSIGERTIVGARSVVMKNLDAAVVVAGNPARVIRVNEQNEISTLK